MTDKPFIFLSYARPDQDRVDAYYQYLKGKGFSPWMDKYAIKGGQNWDFEIRKALKKADIVVIFLSNNSINRRGYVQREIKLALKQYETKLIDDIYIIPIAIDADAKIPEQLEDIQVIKATEREGYAELIDALAVQFNEMDTVHEAVSEQTGIQWHKETLAEVWEGLPGYDVNAEILRITSTDNPELSKITDVLRGWATQQLLAERKVKFDQSPEFHNFGQSIYQRQNSWEAHCGEPIVVNRIMSLVYTVWWYGAGAAHPNTGFHTFNYVTNPLIEIGSLDTIFTDGNNVDALKIVQESVREQAMGEEDRSAMVLSHQLVEGTKDWDCFANFAFTPEGLMILIPPYQIAPYAAGPFHALIDYKLIKPLLKPEFVHALGIEYIDIEKWPFDDIGIGNDGETETVEKLAPAKISHAKHLAKNAPHLILPYEDDEGNEPQQSDPHP